MSDLLHLEEIIIPAGVRSLPDYCFTGYTSLQKVTLPTDLSELPFSCFEGCTELLRINIPASMSSLNSSTFTDCSATPYVIDGSAAHTQAVRYGLPFVLLDQSNCEHQWKLTLSNGMIGSCLYCGATRTLDRIVLPAVVTSISPEAFPGASAQGIIITGQCTPIGARAFANCPELEAVHIPASVTSIADDAFASVSGLLIFADPGTAAYQFAVSHGIPLVQ